MLFSKYPIPKVIFRVVEYKLLNETYDVVVVIHNDPDPNIPQTERICPTYAYVKGWYKINNAEDLKAPGLSYTCELTKEVYEKLGIDRGITVEDVKALNLHEFPMFHFSGEIVYEDVLQKIYKELERIQKSEIVD